jgi:site-specific recombinase XerD
MNSYEQYEQDCQRIREENKILLADYEKWLADKGLAPKTIAKHYSNVDFYINEFLLYEEAINAADGVISIGNFLGYWFIKKTMWASKSTIKSNGTSLKKFYEFMLEKGNIEEEDFINLKRRD